MCNLSARIGLKRKKNTCAAIPLTWLSIRVDNHGLSVVLNIIIISQNTINTGRLTLVKDRNKYHNLFIIIIIAR